MKLIPLPHAIKRMEEIYNYIAKDSPRSAIAMRDRINKTFERISDFPKSGRTTDIINRREMVVIGTPYIIRYVLTSKEIRIIDIKHGAQNQWKP